MMAHCPPGDGARGRLGEAGETRALLVTRRTCLRVMELALTDKKEKKETPFRNRSLQSHLKDWSFLKHYAHKFSSAFMRNFTLSF